MIIHKSRGAPTFRERWDPSDKEYVWFCWSDVIEGSSIATSDWTLPEGWTNHGDLVDQTVEDDGGAERENCNGALISTSETEGTHTITNKVTLADGRVYERSVNILLEDQ